MAATSPIRIKVPHPNAKVKPGVLVASGSIKVPYSTLTADCTTPGNSFPGTEVTRLGPRKKHDGNNPHYRWMFAFTIPNPGATVTYTLTIGGQDANCHDLIPQSTTFKVDPMTTSHVKTHDHKLDPADYPPPGTSTNPTPIEVEDFTPYGDLNEPLDYVRLDDLTSDPNHPTPVYPFFVFADPYDLFYWTAQFDLLQNAHMYNLVIKNQYQPEHVVPGLIASVE